MLHSTLTKTLFFLSILVCSAKAISLDSVCYGTTSNGYLKDGVMLPKAGDNYIGYSNLARTLGRTYVHSSVSKIITEAYKQLKIEQPDKVYKYAETGFKEGGVFKPHKTHQNGLSVDFMTPVIDKDNKSVHLPTNPLNKFGYNIEFNSKGEYKHYRIDYEAMAAHIVILHKQAISSGYDIWRVIFDPKLQAGLFETGYKDYLESNINFSKRKSWVRHDEHYHIDFSVPCEKNRR